MTNRTPRRLTPRKFAAATATGLTLAALVATPVTLAAPLYAASAEAGEAGEAGESGIARADGKTSLLTSLGYFEGTYHIATALYLSGNGDLARAHLEESHHAFYDDIAPELADYGLDGFETEANALTDAIMADAGAELVTTARDAVFARIAQIATTLDASDYDQLMSVKELIALAAAEYSGGVEPDGSIGMAIEFRDSWGFYKTALTRAQAFEATADAELAKAGADLLAQLDGVDALYPALDADSASADPSQLAAAAGWAEIIALRAK